MPNLLNFKNFCSDLKEVTTSKVTNKKNFHSEGLFSEQIFGPLRNYTCGCGIYHGVSQEGGTCKICNVDIVNSNERRQRFAKIILPFPIVNPIYYDLLVDIGGSIIKTDLDKLMKKETSILYIEDDEPVVTNDPTQLPSGYTKWERTNAIYKYVEILSESFTSMGFEDWKIIFDNIDNLLINHIIVLPPDLRPAGKGVGKQRVLDEINRYYTQILNRIEVINNTTLILTDKKLYYVYFKLLQKDANELYQHILVKISKKEGLIRGNILGKRVDFSGRAIIVPEPNIKIDECVLPYMMFMEIYKIKIAKKLLELGKFKLLNNAVDFVDKCIETDSPALFKYCEEMIVGEVCILNRQPTLHRLGMLGFNIKLSLDSVIKVHPLICAPYNADFDGDQMAVYIPISDKAKQEVRDKFFASKNFKSPANETLTTTPSQDIILGIYYLTTEKLTSLKDIVEYKGEKISESMKMFNECLPNDYPLINKSIKKKDLMVILNDIVSKYDEQTISTVLDNIKHTGFKYATIFGTTMSLKNCINDGFGELRNRIYSTGSIKQQLELLTNNKDTSDFLKENFVYSYMIESGARGSWDQVKQIIFTRGFISNFDGNIISEPIKNSLVDGLTQSEFFNSTYGCRKGLLDVALNTGTSGYLSRKLIFTCANMEIADEDDCGTEDYLEVYVDNIQKAKMLINRYYLNDKVLDKIEEKDLDNIVGKTILIRSPIFCTSEKICHKCYGDLYKTLNSRFIGFIAAQTLGERGTQLVLRTFHLSLKYDTLILDVNKNAYTIKQVYNMVKSGEPFYTFSCSPDGEIEVSKVIDAHKDRFEKKMIRITLDNDEYVECTLDHRWILRDGTEIRADQLKIDDSLMPIYFGEERDGYNTVRQNYKKNKLESVYILSSVHNDVKIHKDLNKHKLFVRHHIDENRYNDYPNNLMLLNTKYHIQIHDIRSYIDLDKQKLTVSESNKRRMKDPEFKKKFNEKRNKTLKDTNFNENMSIMKTQLFKDNPGLGKRCVLNSRISSIKIVVDKVIELGLELTDENYEKIRQEFLSNNKRYSTFGFAKLDHSELVSDFTIIPKIYISPNQLQAETRVERIYQRMLDLELDATTSNFDLVNMELFPNPRAIWKRGGLERMSPGYLDKLSLIDDSPPKKSRECKQNEVRMDHVLNEMQELNMELTINNFDKANHILYPNSNQRRKRETLLKHSPNYLDHLNYNHKVKNIEIIELPDYEEFYDLTVDSKYENFALGAGVFIHNSGTANVDKSIDVDENDSQQMKQFDIISDLSSVSTLLHKFKGKNYKQIVNDLFKVYSNEGDIYHIHFECVVAQLMWVNHRKWRLLEDRDDQKIEYHSIQTVPSKESWILGLAFSNPKKHILKGILHSGNYTGIIDKILLGEKI